MSWVIPPGIARRARSVRAAALGWRARYVSRIVMPGMIPRDGTLLEQHRLVRRQARGLARAAEARLGAVEQHAPGHIGRVLPDAAQIRDERDRRAKRRR